MAEFFSQNKKTARERLRYLARTDGFYTGMDVKLAKKQVPHIQGWKTWTIYRKKRK